MASFKAQQVSAWRVSPYRHPSSLSSYPDTCGGCVVSTPSTVSGWERRWRRPCNQKRQCDGGFSTRHQDGMMLSADLSVRCSMDGV